jgi:uncharacterized protein involved in copper resistance
MISLRSLRCSASQGLLCCMPICTRGTSSFSTASPAKSPASSTGSLQALNPRSSTLTKHPILQHWSTICLDQATQKKKQKDIQLCAEAFEVWMKGYVPTISQVRAVDDTILRPFRHCNTSWRDSIVAVRSDLIDLARGWNALGLAGSCPYQPTQDEVAIHEKNREDFESVLSLEAWLMQTLSVTSDG